ncbi:MAG: bifunctional nicotinamidase/pyrazinamidase [Rubripirellula sp.]
MIALLLIDIQNDFLPGGTLAVPEGDEVVAIANRAMKSAEHVVATQDWHPRDHGSFASQHEGVELGDKFTLEGLPQIAWPDHCVQGTYGAEFADQLDQTRIDLVVQKGTDRSVDSYSGFFDNGQRHATSLDAHLKSIDCNEIVLMGLATEYCVRFTVLDALRLGYRTHVVLEGCRGVNLNPSDVLRSIRDMQAAGAQICESLTQVFER